MKFLTAKFMNLMLTFFLVFFFPTLLFCQNGERDVFERFASVEYFFEREAIFNEEFDNNVKAWPVRSNTDGSMYIKNGSYVIENKKDDGVLTMGRRIPFDNRRDHEIEMWLLVGEGSKSYSIITWWANEDNAYWLNFQVQNKRISVTYWGGGKRKKKFNMGNGRYKAVPNLKIGKFYKLTIRKIGVKVYLYIDNVFVAKIPYLPVNNHEIQFTCFENTRIEIGSLSISYLNRIRD